MCFENYIPKCDSKIAPLVAELRQRVTNATNIADHTRLRRILLVAIKQRIEELVDSTTQGHPTIACDLIWEGEILPEEVNEIFPPMWPSPRKEHSK